MKPETPKADTPSTSHPPAPLTILLALVMVFFCGFLVFVYVATKHANPIMLDQHGKPINAASQPTTTGAR